MRFTKRQVAEAAQKAVARERVQETSRRDGGELLLVLMLFLAAAIGVVIGHYGREVAALGRFNLPNVRAVAGE